MTSTILVIPMPLIVSIVVYVAGMWFTALYLGAVGYDYDPFCVIVSSVFWPLFLLFIGIMNLSDWLHMTAQGYHGERPQAIVHRIGSVLHYISLPCRPFLVGRMLKKWKDCNGEGDERI